jgi:cysteine desulfurase
MSRRVYLDWNATAPLRPEARAAMMGALDAAGNPSSVHWEGSAARRIVELAREQVAALVGAEPRDVVFTSGGTEANVMALTPGLERVDEGALTSHGVEGRYASERTRVDHPPHRLFVSSIEHASVLAGGRFSTAKVEAVPVTSSGVVDLDALEMRLRDLTSHGQHALVSIMAANNETGVIQPVRAAADIVHACGGVMHVDAVQAVGKVPFGINEMMADFVSISAHKIGGPTGVGALIRRSAAPPMAPLFRGGGQERGARAGTENVAGIAGFGAASVAVRGAMEDEAERMCRLRDRLEAALAGGPTVIFGHDAERLPNTSLFAVPGLRAETALIILDLGGFAVSSGSACSSGKVARSHVLAAMGVPDALAAGAIRVSIGPSTSETDIDRFLEAWMKLVAGLSSVRRGLAA